MQRCEYFDSVSEGVLNEALFALFDKIKQLHHRDQLSLLIFHSNVVQVRTFSVMNAFSGCDE